MIFEHVTTSSEETMRLGEQLARCLLPGDLVTLEGALGAGKTCLVRGVALGLGADERAVSSPTFVLCQEYSCADERTLVHIDAYRMTSVDDLETIGWSELRADPDVIVALEWPERVAHAIELERPIRLRLEHVSEHHRRMTVEVPDAAAERFAPLATRMRPCPTCGKPASIHGPDAPFCCQRCRLLDLGDWLSERHRLSTPLNPEDEPGS